MIFEIFEEKCDEKKIDRKSEKKEKIKIKIKIDSKSINYFYMFFQTHFTYLLQLYKD